MDSRQRHIIQTVYDKTGLAQYKADMLKASQTAKIFGRTISKTSQFMGTTVKDSFAKVGKETVKVTQKTSTFVEKGKQMKVTWRESAKGLDKFGVTMGKAGGAMQNFTGIIGKAMSRALIVAPLWLAIRSSMMLVIRTTKDMIRAYVDLEEGLARIRTVMHGTASAINSEMTSVKRQILDTAIDSRISIKELAETFYFLKTASLTADQAMSAFEHTVSAMTGTGAGAKEMARAMAGTFNTMGKYMEWATNDAEKFQHIADVLTYTYTKQDVEMRELISGYEKIAPFLSGMGNSFLEIITTIGFLNTRMLRGGRTGRLLGRSFLQLTKNANKLASSFGIVFDPDKPLNFIQIFEQISQRLGDAGKLSAKEMESLRQVFQIRGLVPVGLLAKEMEELVGVIKLAGDESKGFAKKIAEIKMMTITAQSQRLKNTLAVLFEEFIIGYYGAGNLAEALKSLADSLKYMREPIKSTGEWLGWLNQRYAKIFIMMEEFAKMRLRRRDFKMGFSLSDIINAKALFKIYKDMGLLKFQSFEEYRKSLKQQEKEAIKTQKRREILERRGERGKEKKLRNANKEKEIIANNIALLKIKGANELDIARYKLQALEKTKQNYTADEYSLELLKSQNKVIQEQLKYRDTLNNKLISHEIELLKMQGLSEKTLTETKIALEDIILGRDNESRELQHVLDLEKAVTQEKQKQKGLSSESVKIWKIAQKFGVDTATNIAKLLRGQIKRKELSSEELKIFEKQFRSLSEQMDAYEFFTKKKTFGLTGVGIPIRETISPEARREAFYEARRAIARKKARFAPTDMIEAMRIKRIGRTIELKPTIPVDIKQDIKLQLDPTKFANQTAEAIKSVLSDKAWEMKFKKIVEKILDGWIPK